MDWNRLGLHGWSFQQHAEEVAEIWRFRSGFEVGAAHRRVLGFVFFFAVTRGQDASDHLSQLAPTSGDIILSLAGLEARDL